MAGHSQLYLVRIVRVRDAPAKEQTARYLAGRMTQWREDEIRRFLDRLPIIVTRRADSAAAERVRQELAELGAEAALEPIGLEPGPVPPLEPPAPAAGSPAAGEPWRPVDLVNFPPAQEGDPWEMRAQLGLPRAWWETFKYSLRWPDQYFARLRPDGGYGGPLLYSLLSQALVFAVGMVWMIPFLVMIPGLFFLGGKGLGEFRLAPLLVLGGFLLLLLLGPAMMALMTFLGAGVMHGCVLLLGGRGGYQATFRVNCFAASSLLLQLVPYVGAMASVPLWFAQVFYGYRHLHKMDSTNAIIAMLLPLALLFFLVMLVIGVAIAAGAGGLFDFSRYLPE